MSNFLTRDPSSAIFEHRERTLVFLLDRTLSRNFRFDSDRFERWRNVIWVKSIIFTILAPGTVTLLLPYCILRIEHNLPPNHTVISAIIGWALFGLGFVVYLMCARDFASTGKGTPAPLEPPKKLVVGSLYRVSRNPMYVGIVSILIGESVFFQSAMLGGYTAVVFICFYLFVRFYEEPTLTKLFGAEYVRYCHKVPRWLIWRPKRPSAAERHNSQV